MSALPDVYRTQFKTVMAIQLQYRVSLVIWLIGTVLEPVIYLVVWSTVARSTGGQVGSYTPSDFAAYFIVLMLVNHATFTWIIYGFDARIRQGAFSPLLLRPVHPIHADVAENLSYKMLTLGVMLPTAAILALVFHPRFHLVGWALLAFVLAILLAIALRFLVEWTVALLAFWTSRMSAVDQMYFLTVLFLSGQVAPLSLFPAPVQWAANVLPFQWMVAFPAELVLGRLGPRAALAGFAAQAAWLLAAFVLLRVLWRLGLRRYSAVGT
jgi:ABC-2 type transport system permease protein